MQHEQNCSKQALYATDLSMEWETSTLFAMPLPTLQCLFVMDWQQPGRPRVT
eukprot:m.137460 g.137460  ORF g.137460 m.137460 type:complete len:52 (+) comp14898_c1_seq1:95-250(+)